MNAWHIALVVVLFVATVAAGIWANVGVVRKPTGRGKDEK